MDLPLDPVAGPAEVLPQKPDAPSGVSTGVVAPSGAPHSAQFDDEDECDDRPGLTPKEKIEYKALEARLWPLLRPEGLDGPLVAEMSDEMKKMIDKMAEILEEGYRGYQTEGEASPAAGTHTTTGLK